MIGHLLLALASAAGPTRLPPVDECARDPSLRAFRARVEAAADRQDMEAVVRLLDDKVIVDFGGGSGKSEFRERWTSSDAREGGLWTALRQSLALGCALRDGVATAPSFSAQLDPDADPFEMALARPGTIVRTGQGDGARVIARLDWDLVTVIGLSPGDDLVEVRLPDGRTGYVEAGQLRTAGDYRLTMEKRGGEWRITAFVEGD